MGEMRSAFKLPIRRPERKRQLGRPRCRWENSIKLDLKKIR
jgi:hypothetical protein